jgi:hypothetical protein
VMRARIHSSPLWPNLAFLSHQSKACMEVNMFRRLTQIASGVLLIGLLQLTSAQASTRVYVQVGPPAAVVETIPASPHPGWVWRPGYHHWLGARYEWVPGAWEKPPHKHDVWVAGKWAHERRGWYWDPGHWTRH